MGYQFNPFTGTLDNTGSGGLPGGATTQIQFNDGGTFAGNVNLTWNKTTNLLTVGGDVSLNDGGTYTTTLQTVTPTANRVISLPNATGTVALVAGSSGQLVWNNAGAYAGVSTTSVDGSGNITLSARYINSTAGAASAPPESLTGTWFTGGTSTTTKPQFLIEPTGTTSTAWSTSGTGLGVNAPSGFTGNLLDLQVNGTSFFRVLGDGNIVTNTTAAGGFGSDKNGLFGAYYVTGGYHISCGSIYNPFIKIGGAGTGSLQLRSDSGYLGWGATGQAGGTPTLIIARDADNTLAQRNGTAAQTTRLYNTYTDASNYERLSTTWSSNVCYTKPENAGTGSARLYVPVTGSTTVASLPTASTAGAGARAFVTDATATTFLSTVAGGGANKVPVVSDGTNWLIG